MKPHHEALHSTIPVLFSIKKNGTEVFRLKKGLQGDIGHKNFLAGKR